MSDAPVLFWFRRDLRIQANEALELAAAMGPILPVFVLDDALTGPAGANRLAFMYASLRDLDESLDGRLVVRSGCPEDVLHQLADEVDATQIWATADYGPYGHRRDTLVGESLAARGISTHYRSSNYAVAPGTLLSKSGTPYKVFTPFYKLWLTKLFTESAQTGPITWVDGVASELIPTDPAPTAPDLPPAGQNAAWDRFAQFKDKIVNYYDETRNFPGTDGTSRLSPYLKWGTIHPHQLIDHLGDSPGERSFIRQLCWRDFYAEILFNRPDSARSAYVEKNVVRSDTDAAAAERFGLWCEGKTGYPIVDAGMRQLHTQGWMHNRVRMITASFLIKDLHLPWWWGARYFMEHLVDGDLASNNHGWQWVAGTGTDASPYYRVFNPTTQSAKFDPAGDYLRQWLPELAHLGKKTIHDPSTDPNGAPANYPAPIVNHAEARREALARYEQRPGKR
ncbi:MAG: deoxyribodipyrimidine photo-lyase [Acidimicrobiales bacterium]|nr:deoxyribodipyrimidine photo-lyase [Acidimicrobiales bacterium]